jgi:hypothetical protein
VEEFNEAHPYGRRSKVELLWRLGVPGAWDFWGEDPWDLPRSDHGQEAGQFSTVGWVARLNSGQPHLDGKNNSGLIDRGRARIQAIRETLDRLDREAIVRRLKAAPLITYADDKIEMLKQAQASGESASTQLVERLRQEAEAALGRGPYSVTDKTTLPPSGDRHDYWHPAPYWWPNPETVDGLPYVKKDGHRVPGTELYEATSGQYDRTRLQRLFDETTVLALACTLLGDKRYGAHGARLVRLWFLDPKTRMNPHMRYGQVRLGHNNNEGTSHGIIEMKDLYFFLDAVRMLERNGSFTQEDRMVFVDWLRSYLQWLLESPQGERERAARNNHGTLYELQVTAIAAYLCDADVLVEGFRRAGERMLLQFEEDGRQPYELGRATATHYCCFNLQGWLNLAGLAAKCGPDLWGLSSASGPILKAALKWFLTFYDKRPGVLADEQPFDAKRLSPLVSGYLDHYGALSEVCGPPERLTCTALFNPQYGIKPFWMLG